MKKLVAYEDKTWDLVEENQELDMSKNFAVFDIESLSGESIAEIASTLFEPEECTSFALTGILLHLSLQEAFYRFLKMKKEKV